MARIERTMGSCPKMRPSIRETSHMLECDESDTQVLVGAQAAEWFVMLKDGGLSEGELRSYLAWLRQSPTHAAEMGRIEQLHSTLKNILLGPK